MGREVLLTASVGSTNYNLVDELSDYDYKQFVCPTFEDLYNKKMYSDAYTSAECDYTVHDIRKLPELLYKANINFIEVLFAKTLEYDKSLDWLFENKQELATMNLPYLYDACIGTYYEKMKGIHKGTKTTKVLVDKFGYDTKAAMCAYRLLDFITRMSCNNFDFAKSVKYEADEPIRDFLMGTKRGRYTEEVFNEMLNDKKEWALTLKTEYKEKKLNDKLLHAMNEFILNVVKNRVIK